jgi:hypothetical protein
VPIWLFLLKIILKKLLQNILICNIISSVVTRQTMKLEIAATHCDEPAGYGLAEARRVQDGR